MKRVIAFILVIMLMVCENVFAEGIETQIDGAALKWFAQAETAQYAIANIPISLAVDEIEENRWVMLACYDADQERSATIEEALTEVPPPCDVIIVYDSYDNAIIFMFTRNTVAEIPQSVDVYADGKLIRGKLYVSPEEVNVDDITLGFYFSIEEVKSILEADTVFMRLTSDKGTSFFAMSEETMLVSYFMLASVYFGARYSLMDDVYYLEPGLLPESYRNWQIVNDPISGVTFPVTDSWTSEVLNQTNDQFAISMSKIMDDEYQIIVYVCADMLSLIIDDNTKQYIEQSGVTRSELDKIYFFPECMSSLAGVSAEELVLQEYAGKQYYGYKIQLDTDIGWGVIGLYNGYVLNITCTALGATEPDLQGLVESFLNTFQFP